MNNPYALGFVKRAQEYGLNEYQAIQLAKQANLDEIMNQVKEYGGGAMGKLKSLLAGGGDIGDMSLGTALQTGWNNLSPAAKGALTLGGTGLVAGALTPSEDEHGETHRMRNALLGMAGGAAVGGVGNHLISKYLNKLKQQKDDASVLQKSVDELGVNQTSDASGVRSYEQPSVEDGDLGTRWRGAPLPEAPKNPTPSNTNTGDIVSQFEANALNKRQNTTSATPGLNTTIQVLPAKRK